MSWYLTVFFFVVMLFALAVPDSRRSLWFIVAVGAACAASLSTVQGFLCWPLGLVFILWSHSPRRRLSREVVVWCGVTIVTLALYLIGYDFGDNGCRPSAACSPHTALHHPLDTLGFFFGIIGNVVPDGINFAGVVTPVHNTARLVLVGGALFAASVFVLVQSWRHRASGEGFPLPALLIAFALLLDLTITLGRGVVGPSGAGSSNRYVMANLILLTGIVMYAWARLSRHISRRNPPVNGLWTRRTVWVSGVAFAALLMVQVVGATAFGLSNGRGVQRSLTDQARLLVNLDRVPTQHRTCEVALPYLFQAGSSPSRVASAAAGHLGEFGDSARHYFRETGTAAPIPALLEGRPLVVAGIGPGGRATRAPRSAPSPLLARPRGETIDCSEI